MTSFLTFRRLLVLSAALMLFSCAGTKKFTVRTTPARETRGATVLINGHRKGTTPLTLDISQEKSLAIVVTKPGFEAATATVKSEPDFWLALLWTKNDPKAQVIKENEVVIPMKRIPSSENYTPPAIPNFDMPNGPGESVPVPELRKMPSF